MFYKTGHDSTVFTLDLGDNFDTSIVTDMARMFLYTGYANDSLALDLSSFSFDSVAVNDEMFDVKATQKIYVKDVAAQSWILDRGFANLSTSNVLIKS